MAQLKAEGVRAKWDEIYHGVSADLARPARVLVENAHLLPSGGVALDLACGLGGNAVFLAGRNFKTHAWDLSGVAITRLRTSAARLGLDIEAEVCDLDRTEFPQEMFDVVVVSRFLSRTLAGSIVGSLKHGGVLFYQTYTKDKSSSAGPRNPAFLLSANELLSMFRRLRLLVYREEGRVGDLSQGDRDEAFIVAQKIRSSAMTGEWVRSAGFTPSPGTK